MAENKISTVIRKKRKKLKDIRNAERKRIVNMMRRSRMKTFVAKLEKAIADKLSKEVILKAFSEMQKELSRGAAKRVIHKNTASRKISRMFHKVKVAIGDIK